MTVDPTPIYFSKAPLVYGMAMFVDFLKGFLVPYFTAKLFDEGWEILSAVMITLLFHNWTFFQGFKNKQRLWLPLWGLYTFMNPILGIVYPLTYAGSVLISNSLVIGFLVNIVLLFFMIGFLEVSSLFLPLNFFVFLITFFALRRPLFYHLEKETTLLKSFHKR